MCTYHTTRAQHGDTRILPLLLLPAVAVRFSERSHDAKISTPANRDYQLFEKMVTHTVVRDKGTNANQWLTG